MATNNGSSAVHHKIDEQFDSFKARIHDAVDRTDSAARTTESWLRGAAVALTGAIKTHPLAAIAVAAGLGYAVVRLARR